MTLSKFLAILIVCIVCADALGVDQHSSQTDLTDLQQDSILDHIINEGSKRNDKNFDHSQVLQATQYLFNRNVTLKEKFSQISHMEIINNETILIATDSIDESSNNQTSVKIFEGPQFENKVRETNISGSQKAKFTSKKIYLNKNISISQIVSQPINIELNSKRASNVIIKNGYAFFEDYQDRNSDQNRNSLCGVLWRQNLNTQKLQKMTFDQDDCSSIRSLVDIGASSIAYLRNRKLRIINSNTFKVQYEIPSQLLNSPPLPQDLLLNFYHNTQTNQSTLTLSTTIKATLETFIFNHSTQKFESIGTIQGGEIWNDFYLIGIDEGYIFKPENELQHYNKISQVTLYQGSNQSSDTSFLGKQFIAMSSNEELILIWSQPDKKLQTYSINFTSGNYETTLNFELNISGTHLTSSISSDDSHLFVLTETQEKKHPLGVYDFQNQSLIAFIEERDGISHLAFAVFEASLDRFMILLKKEDQSGSAFTHHLQIRKVSNPLEVVNQIALEFLDNETSFGYRLIADNQANLRFLILIKSMNNQTSVDKSLSYVCSIQNNKVTVNVNRSPLLSYYNTYFGSKYLISLPLDQTNIQIYSKQSLELLKELSLSTQSNPWQSITFKDDTLICCEKQFCRRLASIDLSGAVQENNFGKRIEIYSSDSWLTQMKLIFLKQKGLLYFYRDQDLQENKKSRIVFNSSFPIDRTIKIPQLSNSMILSHTYITKAKEQCDLFVYFKQNDSKNFYSFENCEPYSKVRKYPINVEKEQSDTYLWKSSNDKYVIVCFEQKQPFIYQIELRAVNQNFAVVWSKQVNIGRILVFMWMTYTENGVFIMKSYDQIEGQKISIFTPELVNKAETYKIKNFAKYDVNELGSIAMVGESVFSSEFLSFTTVTVIDDTKDVRFQKNLPDASSLVQITSIDEENSKIAICSQTITSQIQLYAWQFDSPYDRIIDKLLNGTEVRKINFLKGNQILLDLDGKIIVFDLDLNHSRVLKENRISLPDYSSYTISKDGSILALLTNQTQIMVYGQNQNLISQIKLQSKSPILSMGFDSKNSLYMVDKTSAVTLFDPGNCPKNFENQNGYCVCLRKYASWKTCVCRFNFVDQPDGTCACLPPFVLKGELCVCEQGTYFFESDCKTCSFWCKTCDGQGTSCTEFSAGFYGIVIGGSILLVALILVGIFIIRRKMGAENTKKKEDSDINNESNEKNTSDWLVEENLEKPLKNSQEDQN